MSRPPPLQLPDDLRVLLARHGPASVQRAEEYLATCPRACVYMTSRRVSDSPTRRGMFGRVLRRPTALPMLSPIGSKFGGRPYVPRSELPWGNFAFLGQVNLAEIDAAVPGLPASGLLGVDIDQSQIGAFRIRWYPQPTASAAADPGSVETVGTYETSIVFRPGWSRPGGKAWDRAVPQGDEQLWQAWNDWSPDGYLDDEREECHRLGGHRSAGLDEPTSFEPPAGGPDDITEYEQLLRITFDNEAGFAWGTNWIYVVVHRDDLREGRLDRAVVTGANY